jgi:hypothetical protein
MLGTGLLSVPLGPYFRLPILNQPLCSALSHTTLLVYVASAIRSIRVLPSSTQPDKSVRLGLAQFTALPSRSQVPPFEGLVSCLAVEVSRWLLYISRRASEPVKSTLRVSADKIVKSGKEPRERLLD